MSAHSSRRNPVYTNWVDDEGHSLGTSENPIVTQGSGGGGAEDVNITSQSAGLATAEGQQDIVAAIQALGGGDASNAVYSGTANVTSTAAALPNQAIGEVILQNDPDNTEDIYIGSNTAQSFRLKPGEWISVKISNLNLIYAKTSQNTGTLLYFARSAAGISGGGGPVQVQLTGSNALYSGLKTVAAAGTRTVLNSDQACREVLIVARKSNTGSIYVGGAAVSSTNYGVELVAGESVRLPVSNLNLIYIDSSVSGEGVSYVAI